MSNQSDVELAPNPERVKRGADRPYVPFDEMPRRNLESGSYVQGMIRSFSIKVSGLRLSREYNLHRDTQTLTAGLAGEGAIDRDTIGVAGDDNSSTQVSFSLNPVGPADAHLFWQANIGFVPYDAEIGRGGGFFVTCYCSEDVFAELRASFQSGRLSSLTIAFDTTLWIRDSSWHIPPSGRVEWFLVPQEGARFTAMETGTVRSLWWDEGGPAKAPSDGEKSASEPNRTESFSDRPHDLSARRIHPLLNPWVGFAIGAGLVLLLTR